MGTSHRACILDASKEDIAWLRYSQYAITGGTGALKS
jgi:hypothetical protein